MATNQLVLLRHAKSDWSSNALSDHDRPLGKRGRRDAPRVGQWIARSGYLPDAIYCSDSERTRETLELVSSSPEWQDPEIPVTFSRDLYLASKTSIIDIISTGFARYARIMLVGHNPGMDMVLHHFCPHISLTPSGKLMTTASVAVIDFDGPGMSGANLVDFRRPAELD